MFFLILQVTETNVEIVNIDYNTKFNIIDAKRKQTGTYKIIATNKHGKDEAEVELVILCKCQCVCVCILVFMCDEFFCFRLSLSTFCGVTVTSVTVFIFDTVC